MILDVVVRAACACAEKLALILVLGSRMVPHLILIGEA